MKENKPFALAGLYDNWLNKQTGEIICTFTILTTKANQLMERIHNTKKRMPVILNDVTEKLWLDVKNSKKEKDIIFQTPDESLILAEEVDKKLFSRKPA